MLLLIFLVPLLSAKHNDEKFKIHLKYNKYANFLLSASRQKKIEELFEKDIFKVVIPNKVITFKKILSNIKDFNSYFFNDIQNQYINKAYEKSRLIIYAYNDEKKILC